MTPKLILMRILRPGAARFPGVFYRLAQFTGWVAWRVRGDMRRRVIRNLLPLCDGDVERAKREGQRVFQHVAQYYVDLATVPRRRMALFEEEHLTLLHGENLEALEQPGPVVAVSAHTGNAELAVQALMYRGRGFVALVEALSPPGLSEYVLRMRSAAGGRFYETDFAGVRACVEALKHGQVLGLMGDRDIQRTGVCVTMFEREVRVPRGPWELARRTNALVLPMFCRRVRLDNFEVDIGEPFRVGTEDAPETDIRKAAEHYASLLEAHLRRDPGQWAVLEDFWHEHRCESVVERQAAR
jgi:phosphatidylinositol dimannoside acyltransferase